MTIFEIFSNHDMGIDYPTDWIPMQYRGKKAKALQISWHSIIGPLDGRLEIYTTEDQKAYTLAEKIFIDSQDNTADCKLLLFNYDLNFIKIEYIKNRIISGQLNIHLSFL